MFRYFSVPVIFILLHTGIQGQVQPDYRYAETVFNTLVRTIDQNGISKPKLIVLPDENLIAKTFPSGEIRIGYGLVVHCRSFGKDSSNAIAHVLSHELMHYYNNHFWAENFGTAYADTEWGEHIAKTGNDTSTVRLYETQADAYGMYYAFSAGYNTLDAGPSVLDSIYSWYHLQQAIPGYPTLADRRQIAVSSKKNIAALIPVFEIANHCMQLAQVTDGLTQAALIRLAASGYAHILDNNIHAKELYVNMAAGKIMEAVSFTDDVNGSVAFPYMLETGSVLYNSTGTRAYGNISEAYADSMRTALLDEAETACLTALKLDKNFTAASIDLSIVYYLKEKYGSAEDALIAAGRSAAGNKNILWPLHEMQAFIAFGRSDSTAMRKYFMEAEKSGNASAKENFKILSAHLQNKNIAPEQLPSAALTLTEENNTETINGQPVVTYLTGLQGKKTNRYEYKNGDAILFMDTIGNYITYDLRSRFSNSPITKVRLAASTASSDERTSAGLTLKSSVAELEKLYGKPDAVLAESSASVYYYAPQHMLVWVQDDTVTKWLYWLVK